MDILVHLPRAGDSFPNIILEAFDAELPVIASNVGGISEILVDKMGGYVVENGNIEDAARKLDYLLDNRELRKVWAISIEKCWKDFLSKKRYLC